MSGREYQVNLVLADFASMGANDDELIGERQKLASDEYLGHWLTVLGHTGEYSDVIH